MSIDIRHKIHSLLRRKEKFFALSYNWSTREIQIHQTQNDYINDLKSLRQIGMTKRMECYVDQPFVVDQNQHYFIYLVSLGDFRKWKMVNGENPIAKAFGICLFDYVYVFLEEKNLARKKMQGRIIQLENREAQERWSARLMKNTYNKHFGDAEELTVSMGKQSDFETFGTNC